MTEQFQLPKYRSLEGFALDQTEQFFKPRTFLDLVFLLLLVFWWLSAFLFPQNVIFRATLFTGVIALFIIIPVYKYLIEDDKSAASPMNRAGKIFIFFVLILISTPNYVVPDLNGFTYGDLERTIVSLIIPLVILWNSFSFQTLKMGYWFYIQKILQACWTVSLIIYVFKGIYLFNPVYFPFIDFNALLIISFFLYLLGSLLPVSPKQVSVSAVSATDLFNQYQALRSRTERLRDVFLFGGFCFLIFLLLQWVGSAYLQIFQFTSFLSLLIGFILIFAPKTQENKFGSLANAVTGQAINPTSQLGNRVQSFAQTIQATEFKKPERVYTIPTDHMKLVSKGKTSLTAAKGTIAVPTVTEKGTALVLMGKSEVETKTEDQDTSKKQEIDGTTTIWLPPEEWDKVKLQLTPKDMSELTETELKNVGIEAVTDIFEKSKRAINDLKAWRGPQGIFSSVDATPSKYSITETEDYSLVRLPGIYVFESNMLELVHILGGIVKVIEMKGVGQYVQILGGFVTVLETPDYSFVQTPFVSVIETPQGEKVRVFGIDIQEGDPLDLEEMRSRIIQDQHNFNQLFTKRVETLFKEDPQLLFAESGGEKLGFIVGEDEVLTDTPRRGLKAIKGLKSLKSPTPPRPPKPPRHGTKRKNKHYDREKVVKLFHKSDEDLKELDKKVEEPSPDSATFDLIDDPQKDPQLLEIEEAISGIDDSINAADEKFLNNEISESKHSEIINRMNERKEKLQMKKEKLIDQLKPKFI
ncbi:MAG: hypothetical protein JSW11_21035 [Candidatus Heimdallarchaeota archaeon]|nr:MAG: hypothetical protein JSW11_21035 [Candidatus Heimdallarchaeota archaeon]